METNTRTKTIKVHTLVIDDSEIERFITDPEPLIDTLRDLLIAKPRAIDAELPDTHRAIVKQKKTIATAARRVLAKQRKLPDRVPCQDCGASIPAYRQGKHKCQPGSQERIVESIAIEE